MRPARRWTSGWTIERPATACRASFDELQREQEVSGADRRSCSIQPRPVREVGPPGALGGFPGEAGVPIDLSEAACAVSAWPRACSM